ncbi:hypothetical protein V1290_000217 [Bradyrhizobium sp. AZCC 1578]|uniref:hypothetical protein n=1 Tax=Bradyrhizobium sp. AZCC 1578 TaxID=3117027 RepID=UPI002FF100B5
MDIATKVGWANEVRVWGLLATAIIGAISWAAALTHSRWQSELSAENAKIAQAKERASNEKIARLVARSDDARAKLAIAEEGIAKANESAAQANARAAEAQLALEKLKAPRLLSDEQMSRLVEKLKKFGGTKFDAAAIPGDPEAIIFLSHITATLERAGWVWVDWAAPEGQLSLTYSFHGKPAIGQLGFFGVALQIKPAHNVVLSGPADALGLALVAEGVEATLDVVDNVSVPNAETVHVIVGKKRQ